MHMYIYIYICVCVMIIPVFFFTNGVYWINLNTISLRRHWNDAWDWGNYPTMAFFSGWRIILIYPN